MVSAKNTVTCLKKQHSKDFMCALQSEKYGKYENTNEITKTEDWR